MAYNFLQLANRGLVRVNEVEMSSSNFTSARGIQTLAKNSVNDAIRDLISEELEWPFNVASTTQVLTAGTQEYALPTSRSIDWDSFFIQPVNEVTNGEFTSNITSWTNKSAGSGASAYTSTGNGRLRITGDGSAIGAVEQTLTTVAGRKYRGTIRIFGNDVTLTVGTTTGGTNLQSTTISLAKAGGGTNTTFTFTATTATSFLRFANTSATAADVDFVRIREDMNGKPLKLMNQTEWHGNKSGTFSRINDTSENTSNWNYPSNVFKTQDDKFGVTEVPNQDNWEVDFDYWTIPADLSSYTDTTNIPDHYEHVLINRIEYYMLKLRSDVVVGDRAKKDYEDGVKKMRTELINRPDEMVAV